jgi:hypothetical protein
MQLGGLDNMYARLTDAYIGWSPEENLDFKILKQSVGYLLVASEVDRKRRVNEVL